MRNDVLYFCSVNLQSLLLSSLLRNLLLSSNSSLNTNTTKDQTDTQPLHLGQAMAKSNHGQDHGEHLAGDCDCDQQDG